MKGLGPYARSKLPKYQPPLPITLFCNQESRQETLKSYFLCRELAMSFIVPPRHIDLLVDPSSRRPICVNPKRDTVYITLGEIFCLFPLRKKIDVVDSWVRTLHSLRPDTKAITHLEIRGVYAYRHLYDWKWFSAGMKAFLRTFLKLETLTFGPVKNCACGSDCGHMAVSFLRKIGEEVMAERPGSGLQGFLQPKN